MARFLLIHAHAPQECEAAFAAWSGFESALRRRNALSSCLTGGHALWWLVETGGPEEAIAMLPPFVAARSSAIEVRDARIP